MHRQTLHGRIGRRSFRNRPRKQHSIPLQAKIVMQLRRRMFLHHENPRRPFLLLRALLALRLRRDFEAALAAIFLESHIFSSMRTRFALPASRVKNPGSDTGIRQNQIRKSQQNRENPCFLSHSSDTDCSRLSSVWFPAAREYAKKCQQSGNRILR